MAIIPYLIDTIPFFFFHRKIGSHTLYVANRLSSDMAEAAGPEARASFPPLVCEHVRGPPRRRCNGYPRQ